jgi:two-component system sensor histidine kinase ChvG
VVAGLVEEMRGPSEAADVRLEAQVEPGVTVLGSDEAIETIVENLVDNAVGFSPPGGAVRVIVAADRHRAHLKVMDQGPGVGPQSLDRIFEKGFSSRPGAGREPAGADRNFGMGLWIVRRNVEAMSGTVRVENRASGGFIVEIVLPLAGPA